MQKHHQSSSTQIYQQIHQKQTTNQKTITNHFHIELPHGILSPIFPSPGFVHPQKMHLQNTFKEVMVTAIPESTWFHMALEEPTAFHFSIWFLFILLPLHTFSSRLLSAPSSTTSMFGNPMQQLDWPYWLAFLKYLSFSSGLGMIWGWGTEVSNGKLDIYM